MLFSIWEVFDQGETDVIVTLKGLDIPPRERELHPGMEWKLLGTYDAVSYNDAMRKRNEFMGWGEYHPILDDNGLPFESDEAPFPEEPCD